MSSRVPIKSPKRFGDEPLCGSCIGVSTKQEVQSKRHNRSAPSFLFVASEAQQHDLRKADKHILSSLQRRTRSLQAMLSKSIPPPEEESALEAPGWNNTPNPIQVSTHPSRTFT